jgi:hypothetical protein
MRGKNQRGKAQDAKVGLSRGKVHQRKTGGRQVGTEFTWEIPTERGVNRRR